MVNRLAGKRAGEEVARLCEVAEGSLVTSDCKPAIEAFAKVDAAIADLDKPSVSNEIRIQVLGAQGTELKHK